MSEFYDQLAVLYHLIFPDWDESINAIGTDRTCATAAREAWHPMYKKLGLRAMARDY